MFFLIGVLVFIIFIIVCILVIKHKIKSIIRDAGLSGVNINDVVQQAKLEAQDTPKSLASMDRIYLKRLSEDFKEVNIDKLKRDSENIIYEVFKAIDKGDSSTLIGNKKEFVDNMIRDYGRISIKNLHIHNTVLNNYKKNNYMATITIASSFQYEIEKDGEYEKVQDRVKIEYVYVIDESKLPKKRGVIGIHCPNCGAPITLLLNNRVCSYCGGEIIGIISHIFTFNCIVRY